LCCSPDGARLLVADGWGTVRLLLASDGSEFWSTALNPRPLRQPGRPPLGLYGRAVPLNADASQFAAVTPNGRQLLVGGWQWPQPSPLTGHADVVLALAGHPGTNRLASGSRDRTARVWPLSGAPALVLRGHHGDVTGVSWSADGSRLATCSSDGTVKVWDPASGLEILTLRGLAGEARAVAFCPDDCWLAVAHGNKVTAWRGAPLSRGFDPSRQ
jgi:WD40 repeat protein